MDAGTRANVQHTAPAVLVVGPDGAITAVLTGRKIRDPQVARALHGVLSKEQSERARSVVSAAAPHLRELVKLAKRIEDAQKGVARADSAGDSADALRSLRDLDARYAERVDRVRSILEEARAR